LKAKGNKVTKTLSVDAVDADVPCYGSLGLWGNFSLCSSLADTTYK
jgi:hypothetical protein